MRYIDSIRAVVACVILAACTSDASAQLAMFQAREGVPDASDHARQSFAPDAELILMGAFGDTTITMGLGRVALRFDPATGRANAWAYGFHSASKDRIAVYVVTDVAGLGRQVIDGFLPVELPSGVETALSLDDPFLNSDRLVERLKTDTTFTRYRAALPARRPRLVGIRRLTATESIELPPGFAADMPTWFVGFEGGKDTAMECFVSATSGQTYCRRGSAAAMVSIEDGAKGARAVARITPEGSVHLKIRSDGRPDIALYALNGERIEVSMTPRRVSDEWLAELTADDLPKGTYFCRIVGDGWTETLPIIR